LDNQLELPFFTVHSLPSLESDYSKCTLIIELIPIKTV